MNAGFEEWIKNFLKSIILYFMNLDAVTLAVHIIFLIFIFSFIGFLNNGSSYFLTKERYYSKKIEDIDNEKNSTRLNN